MSVSVRVGRHAHELRLHAHAVLAAERHVEGTEVALPGAVVRLRQRGVNIRVALGELALELTPAALVAW